MLRRLTGRWHDSQRGQSLVEAAVTIPLLILLLGTAIDVVRIFQTYMILTNATREGARYYSRAACSASRATIVAGEIKDIVVGETADLATPLDRDEDIKIEHFPTTEACPRADSEVTVSIEYGRFRTILGALTPAGSWTLHTHTTMVYTGQALTPP